MPGATNFGAMPPPPEVRRTVPTYRRSRLRLEIDRIGYIEDGTDPVAVMRDELQGEAQEVVLVAALDGLGQVVDLVEVGRGGYHAVVVPLPPLLAVPLLAGCDSVVIAHTHPHGDVRPSQHDYAMTKEIAEALNLCGMTLHDHLIFGPNGNHLSLREAHVLEAPSPRRLEVQA